jgi:serine/threonine protein kinase
MVLRQDGKVLRSKEYKFELKKELGRGSFGVATLNRLTPHIEDEDTKRKIRYFVRKTAANNQTAVNLLNEEIRIVKKISQWKDDKTNRHVSCLLPTHPCAVRTFVVYL